MSWMPEPFVGTDGRERAQGVDLRRGSVAVTEASPVDPVCDVWAALPLPWRLCENRDIRKNLSPEFTVRICLPVSTQACPEMTASLETWNRLGV